MLIFFVDLGCIGVFDFMGVLAVFILVEGITCLVPLCFTGVFDDKTLGLGWIVPFVNAVRAFLSLTGLTTIQYVPTRLRDAFTFIIPFRLFPFRLERERRS